MEGTYHNPIVVSDGYPESFAREGAPEPETRTPTRHRGDTNDENPMAADMDGQVPGDAESGAESRSSVRHSQITRPQHSPRTPRNRKGRTLAHSQYTPRFPRRSARLTTTPTKFSRYTDLYHELKLMVWDYVKEHEARVVYIRNSLAPTFEPRVQTAPPTWPQIDKSSEQVANLAYVHMFAVHGPDGRPDDRTRQLVNPSVDVIVFEPCNDGCRGGHCARTQYSAEDRAKVRFLAVRNETKHLPDGWRPSWETLSITFPNIEVLYLLRNPLRGNKREQYALIRVQPEPREVDLQVRFSEWKEKAGKDKPLASLQYAFVTLKEPPPKPPGGPTNTPIKKESGQRYRCVLGRLTGTDKDIIVG